MSLINQVLKDLEQRREGPGSPANGSIVTTPRYIVAGRGSPFVVYVFGVLLIILSLLIGFLIWDRFADSGRFPAINMGETPVPAPTVIFRPSDAAPAAPTAAPPAADTIVGLVSPAAGNSHPSKSVEKTRVKKEKPEPQVKTAPPVAAPETDDVPTEP